MILPYYKSIKIFSCNANPELAVEIARELGLKLGLSRVSRFADGEIRIEINETVRGSDLYIIQPSSPPVNDNLMELLIMIDAARRASAARITAVIPYYGYARQDRKARARDPITAKLVADLLSTAGADRVLTMDLHCDQIQGFFNIPVDHLRGVTLFTKYFKQKFSDMSDVVVVSPDLGSVARARAFAQRLDAPLAIVDKRRPKANISEVMNVIGDTVGKKAIMLDDMIDTAGSITGAANALKERGASEIFACCSHALLSGPAISSISSSAITELITLNTISLAPEKQIDKIKTLSVAPLFAAAISRIHEGLSISKLFD